MKKSSCSTENIHDGKCGPKNLKKVHKKYGWNHSIHNGEGCLEHSTLCLNTNVTTNTLSKD
jgi:hypothetical protein